MTPQFPHSAAPYPHGTDYEWFATDAVGNLAVFTSAGMGPIPVSALAAKEATDSFTSLVRRMPERGNATLLIALPRPDEYLHFASRGFFAYDWQDCARTRGFTRHYELLAKPDRPLRCVEVPAAFQSLLTATTFTTFTFADHAAIDVPKWVPCSPTS